METVNISGLNRAGRAVAVEYGLQVAGTAAVMPISRNRLHGF